LKISDYNYDHDEKLIAQTPISDRDMSRLMVLNRKTGEIEHHVFKEIIKYLKPGDCLVRNNSRVIPARLYGVKKNTGVPCEFILLKQLDKDRWEVMVRPGRRLKPGTEVVFGNGELKAEILETAEDGNRIVKFIYDGHFMEVFDRVGNIPLPPYIKEKLKDAERYQTVYSKIPGSAAAPTAGLHFTPELLSEIEKIGVKIVDITLHVGLGTFRPVKVENVEEHHMHSEYFSVSKEAADAINHAKEAGGRLICVGTTACRTIEYCADENGKIRAMEGLNDIYIYPGYRFKAVDALITNFHLPESTLFCL
jgi:S-adenosylmethionine:tRNA ribosyltransferase-isomerase